MGQGGETKVNKGEGRVGERKEEGRIFFRATADTNAD